MRVGFRRTGLRLGPRRGFGVAVFVSMAAASLLGILLVSTSAGATTRVRALTDMLDDISAHKCIFSTSCPG
jgi:hypothetical protein